MDTVIKNYMEQMKVGRKQSYKNLALYPLLSTYSVGLEYLLLDEALRENLIEIVEKDDGGSVPELRVMNKSPRMILILDGEELVGAKQNRIVNTTILVQGNATIVIPVSCVEHGRWSYDSPRFQSKERMMSSNLRAMKSEQVNYSVRSSGEFRSDQGAIWDGIAEKSRQDGSPVPHRCHGRHLRQRKTVHRGIREAFPPDRFPGGGYFHDRRQGGGAGRFRETGNIF